MLAERSANGDEVLDVLSISSSTVSRLMEGVRAKIISEMCKIQRETVNEMRKIATDVTESVSNEMRHCKGLFSMLSRSMNSVRGPIASSKTSLSEWETKLNALTTDTDVIFNKEIIGGLLAYNSPNTAVSVFRKHGETDVERVSLSAQTLLFGLQPGDKKFNYNGKIGTLHSEFKFTVIRNAFYNMHWDSCGLFMKPVDDEVQEETVFPRHHSHQNTVSDGSSATRKTESSPCGLLSHTERSASKKIKRPAWLEKKITLDHINEARNFLERSNQSRKKKIRQTPSPFDIASHGALRVYRLLGNYLHVRRGAVRNTFFQGLGYLLVPWSQLCGDVSQRSLELRCYVEGEECVSFDDIPCTEKCSFVSGSDVVIASDSRNNGLLRSLFSDFPEFVLSVEHTVYVLKGGGVQRKHTGGEATKIRRLINLIDVACDFCMEFCGVGNRETFFRAHKYALQCVMIFAILFKAYVDKFMKHRDDYSSAAEEGSKPVEEFQAPIDLDVHGLSLKDIIPGPSTQKILLQSRCLRMTMVEYGMYNHIDEVEERSHQEGNVIEGVNGMAEIEESEEMGIEMI